jgi:hypothetical protein
MLLLKLVLYPSFMYRIFAINGKPFNEDKISAWVKIHHENILFAFKNRFCVKCSTKQ